MANTKYLHGQTLQSSHEAPQPLSLYNNYNDDDYDHDDNDDENNNNNPFNNPLSGVKQVRLSHETFM